jgi:hypothetical protein
MLWTLPYNSLMTNVHGRMQPSIAGNWERSMYVHAHYILAVTHSSHGAGLLVYAVWGNLRNLNIMALIPTSTVVLSLFCAALASAYSTGTIKNYVAAIRTWHVVQAVPWRVEELLVAHTIDPATHFVPPSSQHPKREPYTIKLLSTFWPHLNLSQPLDTAVWACCCIAFFALTRMGKLVIKSGQFHPKTHPLHSSVRYRKLQYGLNVSHPLWVHQIPADSHQVMQIHLPRTNVVAEGKLIHFSEELSNVCNPGWVLRNHLAVNNGTAADDHLFTYKIPMPKKRGSQRVAGAKPAPAPAQFTSLTFRNFNTTIQKAAKKAGVKLLPAHALQIGGTTEYLIWGTPFEVMQFLGRWAGPLFQLYLRKHAEIVAE